MNERVKKALGDARIVKFEVQGRRYRRVRVGHGVPEIKLVCTVISSDCAGEADREGQARLYLIDCMYSRQRDCNRAREARTNREQG